MTRRDFDLHRIAKLRALGWSWRKIGRELGVTHGVVQRAFPRCLIMEAFTAEVYMPGKMDVQHTPLYEVRSKP
jgi:hypothetical protein